VTQPKPRRIITPLRLVVPLFVIGIIGVCFIAHGTMVLKQDLAAMKQEAQKNHKNMEELVKRVETIKARQQAKQQQTEQ
jgi:hypothetical protein